MTASPAQSTTTASDQTPGDRPAPPSRWLPPAVIAAVGAGCLVAVGVGWTRVGVPWASYVGVCVAAAAAVGSAGLALRRATGAARGAWMSFGLATVAWLAAAVFRATFESLLGGLVAPSSLADLFALLSIPALVAGFAVVAPRPRRAAVWTRLLLDAWTCAAAIFWLVWATLLAPLYRGTEVPPSLLLLDLAYPTLGIAAVCLIGAFVSRTPPTARRAVRVMVLAVMVVMVTDTGYATSLLSGSYVAGGPVHLGWVMGYLLVAAAPWIDPVHTGMDSRDSGRPEGASWAASPLSPVPVRELLLTGLAGSAILALVGAGAVIEPEPVQADPLLFALGATVFVTFLVRLAWSLSTNLALTRQLEMSERRLRSVVRNEGGIVLMTELDGTVRYVSGDRERLYGYAPDEIVGRSIMDLIHPEDLPAVRRNLRVFVRGGSATGSARVDGRARGADGTWHHLQCTVSWYAHEHDRLIIIARDISEQVALQEQLDHLTFHDGLTGLPNRAYFEGRVREVLASQGGAGLSVLFLDLDEFTAVNDSVGHGSGDHVLAQAARRLRSEVQAEDTVARFGGDEFAVLMERHGTSQGVVGLAERIVRAFCEPFQLAERDVALTASVGIAFGRASATTSDLLRDADLAMSRARQQGGGRVEVYDASMHADAVRRLELGTKLRQAINGGQFAVEYQPLVDLATSRVAGVEALVRWWWDDALVPPERFIRHAEESGLIVPIGAWVLEEACGQMAWWRSSGWPFGLSVNLSPRQVTEPYFVETVDGILRKSGLSPEALTLEVTEDVLVDDAAETIRRLDELRRLGVRLAIDDFGTGYASLAYLRQLPVDTLKIGPSFVSGLGDDEVLTLLTRTVVRLGQDLGLLVVAEGIERPKQLEMLREMRCPRGQGYLVARPMAARRVESLLRASVSRPLVPISPPI